MAIDTEQMLAVEQENLRLRQYIAQLEGQLAGLQDVAATPHHKLDLRVFELVMDSIADGVHLLDCDGHNVYVNQAWVRNLGYSREELTSMCLWAVDPQVTPERWHKDLWPLILRLGTFSMESTHQRKDGSIVPVEVHATHIRFDDTDYVVAFTRDISERKAQEAALYSQVELFNNLLHTLPFPVFYKDTEGVYRGCNQLFAETVFGLAAEAVIGKTVYDLVPAEIADFYHRADEHAMQQGGTQIYEREMQLADGAPHAIMFHKSVFHREDGSPAGLIGAMVDITQQKRSEAERESFQQQIIEAQRHALHELSTPLIPLSERVVIMPLIGTIDSARAQQVMDTLLEGVAQHNAELVILDITGVSVVDTQVAQAFIQVAQAVKLLGAQVMLTGIQPQIAQTLVHLGTDLSSIQTRGSLQAGIAAALQQIQRTLR